MFYIFTYISMTEIWATFKVNEKIPAVGRYKCLVCGLTVEIEQKFIDMEKTFFSCPICHAGTDGGPRGSQEEIWEFLG